MVDLAKAIKLPVTGNLDEDKLLLAKELKRLTTELGIKTLEEQGIKKKTSICWQMIDVKRACAWIQPTSEHHKRRYPCNS